MVSRRRSKAGRRHWLGCQCRHACSRVCEWTTCAQALVGARVCMPRGDPRRRAPGGTEKATTRPCALSTEDSMVKGGALVGFLGAARTTVKHHSGGAAFRLPACSHWRISAPRGARVWLKTPKGDAFPPSMCVCARQRLDLGSEPGDGACMKHMAAPQLGECTTTRHGKNDDSAGYNELKAKPSSSLHVCARVCMPAV
jgi:hypothetical protein